jgi:hypothetical protein
MVRELDLPRPFDVRDLAQRIAERRDRPVVLAALEMSTLGSCGLWLASGSTDYICYEKHTSKLHQQHIVLHELGHLLCGHGRSQRVDLRIGALVPQLSPATLAIMLARQHGGYADADEAEAELFAYTVLKDAAPAVQPQLGDGLAERHVRFVEVLEQ